MEADDADVNTDVDEDDDEVNETSAGGGGGLETELNTFDDLTVELLDEVEGDGA